MVEKQQDRLACVPFLSTWAGRFVLWLCFVCVMTFRYSFSMEDFIRLTDTKQCGRVRLGLGLMCTVPHTKRMPTSAVGWLVDLVVELVIDVIEKNYKWTTVA